MGSSLSNCCIPFGGFKAFQFIIKEPLFGIYGSFQKQVLFLAWKAIRSKY